MPASTHVEVRIDLGRIRANVQSIRRRTGVAIIAVVKADAYGHGLDAIAPAIVDAVEQWCVLSFEEAARADLAKKTGKSSLMLGPSATADAADFLAQRIHPAVWDIDRAAALRKARPVLSVDTGMQRFACPPEQVEAVLKAGDCTEAFTHATRIEQVDRLLERAGNRGLRLHAAGTSLLDDPRARLDAVRPGLAMYRGSARVSARLVEARDSDGPAGYSGFTALRHGVILAGYSNGIRVGPCIVNGRRARLLEVGMQSSFVELQAGDRVGDEVVLLGDGLSEEDVAGYWKSSPHEALTRLCGSGRKSYVQP